MIGHLRGTILEKHPNQVIVEAAGVGYDVQIPISTYTALAEPGATATLRKPFEMKELLTKVEGCLSKSAPIQLPKYLLGGIKRR